MAGARRLARRRRCSRLALARWTRCHGPPLAWAGSWLGQAPVRRTCCCQQLLGGSWSGPDQGKRTQCHGRHLPWGGDWQGLALGPWLSNPTGSGLPATRQRQRHCWVSSAAASLEEHGPCPHLRVTGVAAVVLPCAPVSAPGREAAWSESVAVSPSAASASHRCVAKHSSGWKLTMCPEGELCARRLAATCLAFPAWG